MSSSLLLEKYTRIVVKIGSALVVGDDQALRQSWLDSVADDVARLMGQDKAVFIVSSGAIALGCAGLNLPTRPSRLDEAQAAACAGQIALMNAYQSAFARHDRHIGQLLLTLADLDGRRSYLNARATIERLVHHGLVPVINENDATATEEIRVGDNDRLAARVAQMVDADLLILLSDIDGLYSANPATDPEASFISQIEAISPDIIAMADDPDPAAMSRGGMRTKLDAAKLVTQSGCDMIIMNGQGLAPLSRLLGGERHSLFHAASNMRHDARHRWLSGQLGAQGAIVIDAGAHKALQGGNSLLAAGILGPRGGFMRGDVVRILGPNDVAIAKGLSNYDSAEVDQICGLKSEDITQKLGYTRSQTVIHRDNMVLDAKGTNT